MISAEARAVLNEMADALEALPRPLSLTAEVFAVLTINRATKLIRDMSTSELSDADVSRLYRAIEAIDTTGGKQ